MIVQIVTSGFVLREDRRFLMAKRADDDNSYPGYWELPGGKHEVGEEINISCEREIMEECGIEVEAREIVSYRSYKNPEKQKQYVELFFKCTPKTTDVKLSHEHSDFKWVNFSDADSLETTEYTKSVLGEIQNLQAGV